VIDGLDMGNFWLENGFVVMQVPEKLALGSRGSDYEDGIGANKGTRHIAEKSMGIVWMIVITLRTGRMGVKALIVSYHGRFVEPPGHGPENSRLVVIHPDCRQLSSHVHGSLSALTLARINAQGRPRRGGDRGRPASICIG
jgi:hypothetical protein